LACFAQVALAGSGEDAGAVAVDSQEHSQLRLRPGPSAGASAPGVVGRLGWAGGGLFFGRLCPGLPVASAPYGITPVRWYQVGSFSFLVAKTPDLTPSARRDWLRPPTRREAVCPEREGVWSCSRSVLERCCMDDEGFVAPRSRLAEGGSKPPRAALAEDRRGERSGRRRRFQVSGGDREGECERTVDQASKVVDGIETGV
jgi:hypothetical protein